jgi:hypothetical protein
MALGGLTVLASVLTRPPPPEQGRAPLLSGAQIPGEVLGKVRAACKDCHSNEPDYPWYSYVAPVSWMIKDDVLRGRARLNFSLWGEYSIVRRERYLSEIANQVRDRGMPLPSYTLLHRAARLSDADVEAIFQWTQTERARLIVESSR